MSAVGKVVSHQNVGVHWTNNDTLLCFIAGILLGCIVASRMFIFGRVTGISGFLSGVVQLNKADSVGINTFVPSYERLLKLAFVGGLIGGGGIASRYLNPCFEDWSSLPIQRLVIGGLFVGFGTTLGNGCTSGHGVCGISNLSLRSLVATCTFMGVAIIVAISCNTTSYLPVFNNTLSVDLSGEIIGVCILLCSLLVLFSWKIREYLQVNKGDEDPSKRLLWSRLLTFVLEVAFGIFFAIAMAISNMTKLSATISFLDLRYWNPALAFIMGGSIFVASIAFAGINKAFNAPMLDSRFFLISRRETKVVDLQLLSGATLFGVGWGLTGSCPGPALVNVGSGNIPPLIYAACIIGGMWLQQLANPYIAPYLKSKVLYSASTDFSNTVKSIDNDSTTPALSVPVEHNSSGGSSNGGVINNGVVYESVTKDEAIGAKS